MSFILTRIIPCLSLFLLVGCGNDLPPIGQLTGTVMMDGKPYPNGSLMFTPTSGGRPSLAATDENGKFTAMFNLETPGALVGAHTITFEAGGKQESEEDEFKPYAPPKDNFKVTPSEITVEATGTDVTITLE